MSKRDFYEILGLSREAGAEEVKKAYRQAALKYHPDRNPGDKAAEEKFKEASEAYEVLADPEQRQRYDQYGHAGLAGTGFHHFTDVDDIFASFGDLFEDFFGFGSSRRTHSRHRRGADLSCEIAVSLLEAYSGVEQTIEVARRESCGGCGGSGATKGSSRKSCPRCRGTGQVGRSQGFIMIATTCGDCRGEGSILADPCKDCHGEGRVKRAKKLSVHIPPGVDTGTQLLMQGEGEAGQEGAQHGDLYIFIHVREDPRFAREGDRLYTEIPISVVTAALGGQAEVPTMAGPHRVQVPPGTETGESVVLEGLGFPHLRSKKKGDLVVRFIVKTPKHLNKRQEELLRQFAEISGEASVKPKKKGLFS